VLAGTYLGGAWPQGHRLTLYQRFRRYSTPRAEPAAAAYVALARRHGIDPAHLAESVRKVVAAVDPTVPMTQFHTQTGLIDRLLRTERLLGFVSAGFGVVSAILAAMGLGGLLAYAVTRRTGEIGVRMALGAGADDVIRMILRDSLWLAGVGVLLGIPCTYAIGKFLRSSLYGIQPFDAVTAAASLFILLAAALLAAWIPARRAARIDPIIALREE